MRKRTSITIVVDGLVSIVTVMVLIISQVYFASKIAK